MPKSDIGPNAGGVISDFQISGQFLINENNHNSRTSNYIEMKLRSVAKVDKREMEASTNFDDVVM